MSVAILQCFPEVLMADQLFGAIKVVDDDPVGHYDTLSQMKEWPQRIKRCPEENLYFIPIYHFYKDTKGLC